MEAEAGGLEELTDEEMAALGKEELVRRLRREEAARLAALVQRGRLMQEVNRQLQGHLGEIRELKQLNRRLQAENRELRDLCCFLDSERQRGRRAARQWQLFGTQASRAVREDLGGCWQKLAELEGRQEELLRENLALKELCLALGEEWGPRSGPGGAGGSSAGPTPELALPPCGPRDLGDGSSSTGSVGSPDQLPLACSPDD
ncbi:coiled-coil domain-containing protein 85B [Panthera pardus]|uniref:Coiled-coil domain containing 85B n=2 Tax=Panthera TaxID=9688 RepID=A0A8C8WV07_PANLE|nr:coiled-coil domain-containing protein 85B [Panthera pardus]XP_042762496.1 coiled-coil domain-containing protein 85B [Panthera leo]XP_042815155.1 coiled-coil domain-containing protein 85B [Panthera tigris]XP_049472634.1 coiled-coil domain-containing protein 85B [Panthera uncia]XP_058545687.1 coiled-coil domain-containing protein 85B [Neofelis nebulosa]XP_060485542.1 coiled-coil domain-containing protein 85B [Panthera onca]